MQGDLKWGYLLAAVIVVCATAALIAGQFTPKLWYETVALVIAFVSGSLGGYYYGKKKGREETRS